MNYPLTRGHRLPRVFVLFSILTLLIISGARASATAIAQDQTIPLDLAAIALTPADLEQAGLFGFGVGSVEAESSGWRTLGDVAIDSVAGNYWFTLQTPEPINVGLARAGWQREYRRVLAKLDPAEPEYVNLSVRSEVGEYADAAGADEALTLLMNGGGSESPGAQPIGDRLEVRSDLDPNAGARLVVAFREGNLIGSVDIIRYASAENPDLDPALLLARQLQTRMDAEVAAHESGLADAALRLSTLASPAEHEGYVRRGGETFIEYGESGEDFAVRDAAYGDAIDVYQLDQLVAPASEEDVPPYFVNRLYQFADESIAKSFLVEMPQKLADDSANSGENFVARLVEEATSIGDYSLTFEIQDALDAGTTYGYRIYVQVGTNVARIQLSSSSEPSIQAAETLATAQVACLEAGSCLAAEQPPVSLPGMDCPPTHASENPPSYPKTQFAPVSMFGADPARSGAQPGPDPSGSLQADWGVTVHGRTSHAPVISDGLIVFGSSATTESSANDYLLAFDATTHEILWCAPTGDAIADPSIDDGQVFIQANPIAGDHPQTFVVALDADTGLEHWQFPIGNAVIPYEAAVTATNGTVYVTTGTGAVFALDEATGNPNWLYQVDHDADISQLALSYPAIDNVIVYISGGNVLFALDANSGEELWDVEANDETEVLGTPSVAGGLVYAGGKHAIYAVDAQTGDERWATDVESPDSAALAVANGVVYATSGYDDDATSVGYIAAYTADNGTQIWRVDLEGFFTAPAIIGEVVYVGAGESLDETAISGYLVALSAADGSVLVNYPIEGEVTAPVIAGGLVYIANTVISEEGQQGTLNVIGGESAPVDETPILDRKSG